jgi:hypothetical protein
MSQLTIQLSDKADALIAQLQKEIFNRRRKKVSAAGVIETLVESGAKSQSDKRFATSWKNLVADIEKAAKVADAHGAKPANLSDEEWVLVLAHRTRATKATPAGPKAAKAPSARSARTATNKKSSSAKPTAKSTAKPTAKTSAPSSSQPLEQEAAPAATKPARRRAIRTGAASAAKATAKPTSKSRSTRSTGGKASVAKRMAKAVGRLSSAPAAAAPNEPVLVGVFAGTGNGTGRPESERN